MSKYFEPCDEPLITSLDDYDCDERTKKAFELMTDCVEGEVSLPFSIIEAYSEYYHTIGGRYDVRKYGLSAMGLYSFYKRFPDITPLAFKEIGDLYIQDLFEDYKLEDIFEKMIETFGKTDDTFRLFILYVKEKADELDSKYEMEAAKLDDYRSEYDIEGRDDFYQFISYLQRLITDEHFKYDAIVDSLPSPELVKKDAMQLSELARFYRCTFGTDYPTSYFYTKVLACGLGIRECDEKIQYYVSAYKKTVDGTFTTREFMDSVRERREKRLGKK